MADLTNDGIQLRINTTTPTPNDWPRDRPRLSCRSTNQLSLEGSSLKLDADKGILFQGNGQISAVGDLSFLTAGTPTVPALTIFANGNVGIGTGTRQPTDKLEIAGSLKLETGLSVNQFSGDITNSDQVVPTAKAVKTYVDSKASPELPDESVTDRKIANNAVTTDKIADDSITAAKIKKGAIARDKLDPSILFDPADGAVTTQKIANGAVTAAKIADNSITTAKIQNGAITQEKLADSIGSSQWKGKDGEPISYSGNVGIGTSTPQAKLQIATGAIMPSAGNSDTAGIMFPKNAFGGGGDAAWIRYYARTGEATTLEIGTSNDPDDHIALMPSGNVGIGTTEPQNKLHVKSNSGQSAAALIENTSEVNSVALLLRLGQDRVAQGSGDRFITFAAGENTLGYMMSNDGKNVAFTANSSDYAECLPRLQEKEVIEPGDIVGVLEGKVTRVTENANHVMAITDRPIVLGNAPAQKSEHLYEKVSFLGQVPVKVRGKVSAGDCIVPSGLNDGTGISISRQEMTLDTCSQIVGTAWESSEEEGVKRVNTVIGLNSSYSPVEALMRAMQTQQAEIDFLKTELKQLREQ